MQKNSIFLIAPYKYSNQWVFDDETTGLLREAFVAGADTVMDILTKDIPNAENGFKLFFSHNEFPESTRFEWHSEGFSGNYYYWPEHNLLLWLCPALFLYYPNPPKYIYANAQPLS